MISTLSLQSKTTLIGLDLGTRATRAAQATRSPGRYTVARAVRCEQPDLDPGVPDESRSTAVTLPGSLRPAEFHGKRVRTALNSPDLELHALELPAAVSTGSSAELARVVRWEVERLTTDAGEDLETRHWPLPATTASGPNAIGVAASREKIVAVVAACRQAGLVCTGVDAAAAALCRFGGLLQAWDSEAVWGILDLGYRLTRLVLCVDDVPVLARNVGGGGAAWTQRIAESLQISPKTAEVQKRDAGLALRGRGIRAEGGAAPPTELASIITGVLRTDLRDIALEIKRSYEYVLGCYPGRRAADLVLVGAGAAMKNLPEYLNNALGITVRRASAYSDSDSCRVEYPGGRPSRFDEFALAIGLAVNG